MPKRILVPLDQTPEAEAVLALVVAAARGGASVRLVHVAPVPGHVEDDQGHVVVYADQEMARLEAEGLDYLATVQARLGGLAVESAVRFGDPAEEIVREAEAFGADLIAMSTDCRGPLRRLVLGSVSQEVCRRTSSDVLVYRPGSRPL